ncbi:MAG: type II toxin-antitoxin system VapC family toxin, partial [Thermomicrobiales bacterium]
MDSSVAAKWFFDEDDSAAATSLINTALAAAEPVIAPHMLPSEVTNIIRQRIRRGTLTSEAGQAILTRFLTIPIELRAPASLYRRALEITNTHNLPAVYDA